MKKFSELKKGDKLYISFEGEISEIEIWYILNRKKLRIQAGYNSYLLEEIEKELSFIKIDEVESISTSLENFIK